MAWDSNPKIRGLADYCNEFGYLYSVFIGLDIHGKQYTITTFGKTKKLCKVAGIAGDQLDALIQEGVWPEWPDDEPKISDRERELKEAHIANLEEAARLMCKYCAEDRRHGIVDYICTAKPIHSRIAELIKEQQ